MFNGMMDPELMRMAQEQMSRMSPAELARIQQQMMSNPELIKMASESMQNLRPEDFKIAAEQLKRTRPEDMAEIGEKMAKASPEELAAMRSRMDAQVSYEINAAEMLKKQMMSNPELIKMASESMQNLRPEDFKIAAEQLKRTHPEDMAEIGEKMAKASPEELAAMRSRMDAQVSYEINAAEMLKKQGNDLHNQGKYKDALEKYMRAKNNLKDVPTSKGINIILACSLNMMSCYLKTKQYEECISEGTEVLAYDAKNLKALYRRGQAYKELGQLGDAVSDLSQAHEVSQGDETIADVLRDAEERLIKEGGGRSSRGVIIEEITDEATVSSENHKNSISETSQRDASQSANFREACSTSTDQLEALKDDPESTRSFQNFISRTDPETLSAASDGKVEGISPEMLKTASSAIGKMSLEELQKMFQLASSFQGENPFLKGGSSFSPGSVPSELSPDMLKTASDMMGKMSPENLQKMFEMSSALKKNESSSSASSAGVHTGTGPIPSIVPPDMLKMASDMMGKMSPEERQKMFEMASSLRGGQERAPSTATYPDGLKLNELKSRNLKVNESDAGESSSSLSMNSSSPQSSFVNSSADLHEQMRNKLKDPATRQMFTSMMKNMNPKMMANMSEQMGFKLSREDAEKAQQAMASLSPDALDTMMKWADRIQRGTEGARKTKNWLMGRPGMILAVFMLLLAVVLHWFGFIGK